MQRLKNLVDSVSEKKKANVEREKMGKFDLSLIFLLAKVSKRFTCMIWPSNLTTTQSMNQIGNDFAKIYSFEL